MNTKHKTIRTLPLALLALCLPCSAGQQKDSNVQILNKEVKRVGENVNVNMDMIFDDLNLKSNRGTVVIPMIVNQGDTAKLPAVEVMGRKRYIYYQRNGKTATESPDTVIKYTDGEAQTVHYSQTTPYRTWMENSQLVIGHDLCGCNQSILDNGPLKRVGEALPGPMKMCYAYVQPKAEGIKARDNKGTARLQFGLNNSTINQKLANNQSELEKLRKTLDVVRNDTDVQITSIELHGYASPDGPYANNEKLAKSRTAALNDYLRSYYPVEKRLFTYTSTAEDWKGVKDYLAQNSIPQQKEVKQIMASFLSPDEKERAIAQQAPEAHRYLLDKVYPQLRRTDYTIHYNVRSFNLEEARRLIKTQPYKLSQEEMYAVANSYEKGSKEFNEVFDVAVKMFPDDELANLNAAYTAIDRGDKVSAEQYLEKAGNSPQTDNARGALAVLKKDYAAAQDYFTKAADAGLQEAKDNLEELKKRM